MIRKSTKEEFITKMKDVHYETIHYDIPQGEIHVMKAFNIAMFAHDGQFRTRGVEKGQPYFNHPSRVSGMFSNWRYRSIGLLHDVIEDTEFTANDLLEMGVDRTVVDTVVALSKVEGENYYDFIMRIRDNNIANEIKIADIKDNMSTLEEGSLKDKYRLALYILETT